MKLLKSFLYIIFIGHFAMTVHAQEENAKITFPNGGTFFKDEVKYPGASIFQKDLNQVEFEHQGARMWCDLAVFYREQNKVRAFGNVLLKQGDTVQLTSEYIEYNGNNKLAIARDTVVLQNPDMTLETDTLYFDRNLQQAYYKSFSTVKDSSNVLTSNKGRYFLIPKRYQFRDSVVITNPEYLVESTQLDYYTTTKNAYMYGSSTVTGEDYKIYCERGFYDTKVESGYGLKNTRIDYSDRIIKGDSVFFDKVRSFASATNNIIVIDTINKGIIRAHYAEVFKDKDSLFVTKKAVAINEVQNDSIYIHGDTLMVTGKPEHRILRAFQGARFYKTDLSGKCDSIHSNQKTGLTQLITKIPPDANTRKLALYYPILWSGENQMTGDSIHLISNTETEQLDSLKVFTNAFVIEKDTLSTDGYNQVKGKYLYGKFFDNALKYIYVEKNTEVIYYMYNDKDELIGINKTIPSAIEMTLNDNQIEDITFYTNVDGDIFPEKDLPVNARKLGGFIYRGDERILHKDSIFSKEDLNIKLQKIRGIDNPIDINLEEMERNPDMPLPQESQSPKGKATRPKPLKTPGTKKSS